jgi:glutathione peroxidase-family protein
MEKKQAGLTRFYFINTNGISHYRELLDLYEILQSIRDNEIDVFGFSETNLDSRQPHVRKQLEDICQEFYGTSVLALSSSTRTA